MKTTRLTPQPCRFKVDGGYREGEYLLCKFDPKRGYYDNLVRDSSTGEYFELDEPPELIEAGSHPE